MVVSNGRAKWACTILVGSVGLAGCGSDAADASGESDDERVATATSALVVNANVPYLRQRDYTGIGESACAPTSLAMLLRFYYPNSNIDVREIYHAGLQVYGYDGPALGYRNLSWGSGYTTDPGPSAIPSGYSSYYSGLGSSYSRGNNAIQQYLLNVWGINSSAINTEAGLYAALANGPVVGHVWGHGNAAANWGHYLVIRGYDDKGTASHTDDVIYVNDPYDKWGSWDTGGQNKQITYHDFFVSGKYGAAWFRDAISLSPQDTNAQRQYTVIVDTGHNSTSGNSANHLFQVDDINDTVGNTTTKTWWMRYGADGDYYYPKEANHAARWTPKLMATGKYDVAVKFLATPNSGNVTYRVYNSSGTQLTSVTVNQYSASNAWSWSVIASSASLSNGSYVRATEISANSSIDVMKFKYIGP